MLWPLFVLLHVMPMLWLYMQLCISSCIDIGMHSLCVVMSPAHSLVHEGLHRYAHIAPLTVYITLCKLT